MQQIIHHYTRIEQAYAKWGFSGNRVLDMVLAHIRMIRPITRLWFDTLMPLSVIWLLTGANPPFPNTIYFVLAVNLVHISATILNDLMDKDADKASTELLRSTRPIANGIISTGLARFELILTSLLSFVLVGLISFPLLILFVVLWLLMLNYELPPLRLQSRPIISQVFPLIGFLGALWTIIMAVDYAGFWQTLPYLFFITLYMGLGETLVKDIRDIDNDEKGGKITTAVKYGAAKTTNFATIAYILAFIPLVWFVVTYPELPFLTQVLPVGIMIIWIAYTQWAARQLRQGFSKQICISLHMGSICVFSLICLIIILSF